MVLEASGMSDAINYGLWGLRPLGLVGILGSSGDLATGKRV